MEKVLNTLLDTLTVRRIFIAFIITAIFFIKETIIVSLIDQILLVPNNFSNIFLDILFCIASIALSLWFIYLFRIRNYKPSYIQIVGVISCCLLIIYFFFNADIYLWEYHTIFNSNLHYIWLIVIPSVIFILFHFISFISPVKPLKKEILPEYCLIHDNPKVKEEKDILKYDRVVDKLFNILTNQESTKSLTIGLVGPWGNGKSSVIQMLLDRFVIQLTHTEKVKQFFTKEKIKGLFKRGVTEEYLIIHFLPYLNHNDQDLITEFFRGLSSKLKPYNGKLSNLVLEYSKRLVDLYKSKINLNFFEKHISSFEKTSAKEMYDDINARLKETDKKIIVFVDDLDRLNAREILQVLKLIRNSADFSNVIFLVAMDKNYVVNLLTDKREILNARFIDKFFQLEVYLPAIRKENLRAIFKNIIIESTINFNSEFTSQLEKALNDEGNLFDDYIHNLRDVKRTVNQIVFEYSYTGGAINLKDFFNFIYFKLKYPQFVKILSEQRVDLLKNDMGSEILELKTESKPNNHNELISWDVNYYDYKNLERYSIFKDFFKEDRRTESPKYSEYTFDDRVLVLKTLAYLFGEENRIEDTKSIKRLSNFNMLIEQRIFENYFSDIDFENLFDASGESLANSIDKLFFQDKLSQLIDRIELFNASSESEIKTLTEILIIIYNERSKYNQYEAQILKILNNKLIRVFEDSRFEKTEVISSIKDSIFDNNYISAESKLRIITELWEEKYNSKLWGLEKEYLVNKAVELYDDFLNGIDDMLWPFDNYTFDYIGRKLSQIESIKVEIAKSTKEFWASKDIELLCVQSINIEPWSIKGFTLSDVVEYAFNSKKEFVKFVTKHNSGAKATLSEFQKFFDLYRRREYRGVIFFTFEKSELMKKKIERQRNDPSYRYDENNGKKQLFFETDCLDLQNDWQENHSLYTQEDFLNLQFTIVDDKLSIFMATTEEGIEHLKNQRLPFLLDRIRILEKKEYNLDFKRKDFKEDNNLLPEESEYYFKLISEQPKN
ncbi:MAG: hypothetical protein CL868_14580 [Cytophagaceae bacterium]|nr:hypothetical protein [Cytophagaceae bacterium]